MSLYGDLANPPAIPALLPPALGIALGRPLRSAKLPPALRSAYARALLHRGDTAAAAAIVERLPDGADAADLRGQLAEGESEPARALRWYVRAHDFERAQRLIDLSDTPRRLGHAQALEAELVAALAGESDAGVRARALWRQGQITNEAAAADPANAATLQRRALSLYERALALAPNEETYLLAAGRQALNLGDKAAAAAFYGRALEAVPDSADAQAGLVQARS